MVKTLRWNWRVAVSNCTGGLNRDEHRIKCNDRHGFGVFHLTLAQNLLHGSQTVDKTTPLHWSQIFISAQTTFCGIFGRLFPKSCRSKWLYEKRLNAFIWMWLSHMRELFRISALNYKEDFIQVPFILPCCHSWNQELKIRHWHSPPNNISAPDTV